MAHGRPSIDAGYIMHGHGTPGGTRAGSRGGRVAMLGGGAALIGYGLTRRGPLARWLSIAGGATMLASGVTMTTQQLPMGARGRFGRVGGLVEKMKEREWSFLEASVVIDRPLSQVYEYVRNVANWSRIFTGVREAHLTQTGQLGWTIEAPGGRTIMWRGRIVEDYPNQLLSWESVPDNVFDETGSLRFEKEREGATQVTIAVAFRVAGGVPGMMAGETLGRLTEEITRRDLVRLKDLVEREMQPAGMR